MLTPIRRIVTGHDAADQSIVLMYGTARAALATGPDRGLTNLWVTDTGGV